MTSLEQWQSRWGIPDAALRELCDIQTVSAPTPEAKSESAVQSLVRLEAARKGIYLWRNNVGASRLENGSFVRWGLANDSDKLNKVLKSADLIGIRPIRVTVDHIGSTIGQFVSREVKRGDWKYMDNQDERAQLRWATLITQNGGDARIVSGPGSFGP